MRFFTKSLLFWIGKVTALFYKGPSNTSYWWNFGFYSFFFLIFQIITGIFLAMFYNPSVFLAYASIIEINNEIYFGWWIRALHANGASFFFAVVYIHMARGLYYGSFAYPRELLWVSGMVIWLLMIVTAFLGYILPWGQMSFWGAMVMTSLLASVPLVGSDFVLLLWGGFSIDDATLHRFYSLHFALPFIILMVSIIHFCFLHEYGSNNPLGIPAVLDNIPFVPYFVLKDTYSLVFVFSILFSIIFLSPDLLGHPDNYQLASFLVTPAHIVPEWYFLPLYAVLRSVSGKLSGIVLVLVLILALVLIPFYSGNNTIRSGFFKPLYALNFWFFISVCLVLGMLGGLPVIQPYTTFGLHFIYYYFISLFVIFPSLNILDRFLYDVYVFASIERSVVFSHDYELTNPLNVYKKPIFVC